MPYFWGAQQRYVHPWWQPELDAPPTNTILGTVSFSLPQQDDNVLLDYLCATIDHGGLAKLSQTLDDLNNELCTRFYNFEPVTSSLNVALVEPVHMKVEFSSECVEDPIAKDAHPNTHLDELASR